MSPSYGQNPEDFEERLSALERQVARNEETLEKNNQNITDSLKVLIEALMQMRQEHCDLPPGCEMALTVNEEEVEE